MIPNSGAVACNDGVEEAHGGGGDGGVAGFGVYGATEAFYASAHGLFLRMLFGEIRRGAVLYGFYALVDDAVEEGLVGEAEAFFQFRHIFLRAQAGFGAVINDGAHDAVGTDGGDLDEVMYDKKCALNYERPEYFFSMKHEERYADGVLYYKVGEGVHPQRGALHGKSLRAVANKKGRRRKGEEGVHDEAVAYPCCDAMVIMPEGKITKVKEDEKDRHKYPSPAY